MWVLTQIFSLFFPPSLLPIRAHSLTLSAHTHTHTPQFATLYKAHFHSLSFRRECILCCEYLSLPSPLSSLSPSSLSSLPPPSPSTRSLASMCLPCGCAFCPCILKSLEKAKANSMVKAFVLKNLFSHICTHKYAYTIRYTQLFAHQLHSYTHTIFNSQPFPLLISLSLASLS